MSRSLTLVAGLAVALPASGQGCDPLVVGVMEAVDAVCSCVVEETAFVADYDGKLMISNVRHPALPVPMGELVTTGRPNALAVHGSVAYVSNIDPDTVDIVDISQPWAPVLLGTIPLAVTGMEVVDGMLYAIAIGDGLDALHVFDLGVPQTPQEIGTLMLPDGPARLTIDGDYAYMTLIAGLGGDLAIADIKDPANPLLVSVLPMPIDPLGIDVEQGLAVVGGRIGLDLVIVDVTDPLTPTLLGVHPVGHTGPDVRIKAGKAFVAGEDAGLSVYDIRDPMAPTLVGGLDTPGGAYGLWLDGSDVYIADRDAGVRVIDGWTCLACTPADQADPFTVLSGHDVGDFVYGFQDGNPHADIDGDGFFTLTDINLFIDSFFAGCGL